MAIGLPLGRSFQSISIGILLGALIFDLLYRGDWASRGRIILKHPVTQGALVFFLPMLISMAWTEDTGSGMQLLKTFIPLLLVAPVLSGMPLPTRRTKNTLLDLHLAAIVLCTLIGLFNYLSLEPGLENNRDWIPFINHIRLSLVLLMGIILCIHRFESQHSPFKWILLVLSLWFLAFMILAEMMTGLAIGFIILFAWTIHAVFTWTAESRAIAILSAIGILLSGAYMVKQYSEYYTYLDPEGIDMDARTTQGNGYWHVPENFLIQDGHYVWRYICREELREAWKSRSTLPLSSVGPNGGRLEWGLIRYLTSKGYRKDAEAVLALSNEEISSIEMGTVSTRERGGLNRRFHQLFFEWDSYRNGGNPSSNSLTRRIEYWKASLQAILQSPWLGSGVGDAQAALDIEYSAIGALDREAWHKSHQQYLSLLLMLGIPLGLLSLSGLFLLARFGQQSRNSMLFQLAFVVLLISFLTENTLETQTGMSFLLFYTAFRSSGET